ncbi:MAG: S8 family serine peptidase, partial [Pseudomonadota bacterium]
VAPPPAGAWIVKMPRRWCSLAVVFTLLALLFRAPAAGAAEYVPGEIIVKMKPGCAAAVAASRHRDLGVTPIAGRSGAGLERLLLPPGLGVEEAVLRYRAMSEVAIAQPNYIFHAAEKTPDDPYYPQEWHLPAIDAPSAWQTRTNASAVIVAVIDSGVDYYHPDFYRDDNDTAGNFWPGLWKGECPDFVNNDNEPLDDCSTHHGTHVAGIIGAAGNNALGVSGVCWRVQIMPLKVLGQDGEGSEFDVAEAVRWAADHGAKIINLSMEREASPQEPQLGALETAIATARSHGILVVTAAGNGNGGNVGINLDSAALKVYPGCFDEANILNVAATTGADRLLASSNYGKTYVDIAAPGASIWSTIDREATPPYALFSGTSMAAAVVSGTAALIWAERPELTLSEMKDLLISGCQAHDLPVGSGGILNAASALGAEDPPPPPAKKHDSGGGCFVATAAYGSSLAGEVRALREFRDRRLLLLPGGPWLVGAYYRLGPPGARYIGQKPWLRASVRVALMPTVAAARLSLKHPFLFMALLLGVAFSLPSPGRRRAPVA